MYQYSVAIFCFTNYSVHVAYKMHRKKNNTNKIKQYYWLNDPSQLQQFKCHDLLQNFLLTSDTSSDAAQLAEKSKDILLQVIIMLMFSEIQLIPFGALVVHLALPEPFPSIITCMYIYCVKYSPCRNMKLIILPKITFVYGQIVIYM